MTLNDYRTKNSNKNAALPLLRRRTGLVDVDVNFVPRFEQFDLYGMVIFQLARQYGMFLRRSSRSGQFRERPGESQWVTWNWPGKTQPGCFGASPGLHRCYWKFEKRQNAKRERVCPKRKRRWRWLAFTVSVYTKHKIPRSPWKPNCKFWMLVIGQQLFDHVMQDGCGAAMTPPVLAHYRCWSDSRPDIIRIIIFHCWCFIFFFFFVQGKNVAGSKYDGRGRRYALPIFLLMQPVLETVSTRR